MSECEHDKRFTGVFLLPPEDRGCVACAFERVNTENKSLTTTLQEALDYLVTVNGVPMDLNDKIDAVLHPR